MPCSGSLRQVRYAEGDHELEGLRPLEFDDAQTTIARHTDFRDERETEEGGTRIGGYLLHRAAQSISTLSFQYTKSTAPVQ